MKAESVSAQFVRNARRANWKNVRALRLGYDTSEFTFVESRNMHMAMAREVKAGAAKALASIQ